MKIGFIGQGYIGKNYADDFERRGYDVIRYALEEPYAKNKNAMYDCDIVFIAVPTPTTPAGFDASIVEESLSLVGKGKTAVIKSTVIPGTTKRLQEKYPEIFVLVSPEFLSEATAAHDAAHPFSNIVGIPNDKDAFREMAEQVHAAFPHATFSLTCDSDEAELIKYAHNLSGYMQILLFNIVFDAAKQMNRGWENIGAALHADPLISNRYANPVHKSGRGAGGHCFIKDFAAFKDFYGNINSHDVLGSSFLDAAEKKNIDLLLNTKKDTDLLTGVYGNKVCDRAVFLP